MARYPYQSFIQDGNGRAVEGVTVTVYEADTTTGATIYAAKTGGTAITDSYVTTDSSGYFLFYVDTDDYAEETLFDIMPSKSGYEINTIEDILVHGITGYQPVDSALTDISALAVTDGNIIIGDGSGWVAESGATARASLGVAIGSDVQEYGANLDTLSAATIDAFALTILDDTDAATVRTTIGAREATTKIAGDIVQIVNTKTGAVATGTTAIPHDDTIPQITEGDEFMTLAITPTSATNYLKIDVVICLSSSNATMTITAALFQDATAGALAAMEQYQSQGNGITNIYFSHYMLAGTTSATTFRVRGGASTGATTTLNGAVGSRIYGGVMASSITIQEIKV